MNRLRCSVSKLAGELSSDAFFQGYAELENGVRCMPQAQSDVLLNAVSGREYDLTYFGKVTIDPVSEAEALFYGNDKLVHLEEVKNTLNAFCEKAQSTPQQFDHLLQWRAMSSGKRVVTVKVRTAAKLNATAIGRFRSAGVPAQVKGWLRNGLEVMLEGKPLAVDAVDALF